MSDKAIVFAAEAVQCGWTTRITPGRDSGDNPFVTVDAVRGIDRYVSVTWHTRGTGTYRLFDAVLGRNGQHVSLTAVRAELARP